MNKKVLAFDMDGTILKTDHVTFNPSAIVAIKEAKEKGHKAIIATGRSLGMIIPVIEKNKIEGVFDYIVCNNGSYTYDVAKDKIMTSGEVGKEQVKLLFEDGKATGSIFCAHSNQGKFVCMKTPAVDTATEKALEISIKSATLEETNDFIENNTIVQASIKNHPSVIKELAKDLSKYKNVDAHIANDDWVDLNPIGASKLVGLEVVSKEYDMPLEDFIAFGDSGNDLQMLTGAGVGVAMGNGNDDAKEAADIVIGDCDSDAIATFIRETL